MALILLGNMVQDARGSVNGTTFSRNKYGAYARAKVSPVQPRTTLQLDQRAIFATASQGWRNLTATEMAAWASWAAANPFVDVFGNSQILSANAAYTKQASICALLSLGAPFTPPAAPTVSPTVPSAATSVASTTTVTLTTPAQTVSTGFYVLWTTPGLSPGASFAGSKLQLAGFHATTGAATTVAINPVTRNTRLGWITGQTVVAIARLYDPHGVYLTQYRFTTVST
jgi:hypothetical protein